MLSLPSSVRVFLAAGATDMRKSIDGLAAATRRALRQDPFTGDLFVFCNRRRDRVKILYWERSGFWLLHKRLESGTFSWPSAKSASHAAEEIDSAQLAALLGGLVVSSRRQRWFSWKPSNTPSANADLSHREQHASR